MAKITTHYLRFLLAGWLFSLAFANVHAQTPVIVSPANNATIATSGTVVQVAANPQNNFSLLYLTDLATNTLVYSSGYNYGIGPLSLGLPPGLRPGTPYRIQIQCYTVSSGVLAATINVSTDNVATASPYPVITAPAYGRPLGTSSVTVQLAANPYNNFTVVEAVDLSTNTFLHQSPYLYGSAAIAYTIPLSFNAATPYRIQARNYASIGGMYQTEITVNSSLPAAKIYTPVANAALTQLDYGFQADPVNSGTPPVQYMWNIEPTGSFNPAQQPITRYGQSIKLADYLIPGRTYRTRVTGLMGSETTAPASGWNSFSLATTAVGLDTATFQGKADYMLRYIDKSQIPTQILYDRVFPWAHPDLFNQQGRQDTSGYTHFLQTYGELYNANYNAPNTMLSPELVESLAFNRGVGNTVPIGVLTYQFNVMDTTALSQNLFTYSGGFLYDVANRSRSPYWTRNALVAAPLVERVQAGTVSLTMPTELVMGNTTRTVSNVQVTGGDLGQTVTLTPGGAAASLSYAQAGKKVIRLRVTFSDNTTQTTFAILKVTK